jgi:hypothetical protein
MKLKKLLLICICLFSFNFAGYAQRRGDFRVAVQSEVSFFNFGTLTSYGLSGEFFIHKNFSLNYQYSIGVNQNNDRYIHFPGAVAGFVEMFRSDSYYANADTDDDGWAYMLLLAFIIPEGVSFHTYPREWLELSPFVNPLTTDYNILGNNRSTLTLSLGMKMHLKPAPSFSISPHFGLKHIYKNGNTGNFYGIGIGWIL